MQNAATFGESGKWSNGLRARWVREWSWAQFWVCTNFASVVWSRQFSSFGQTTHKVNRSSRMFKTFTSEIKTMILEVNDVFAFWFHGPMRYKRGESEVVFSQNWPKWQIWTVEELSRLDASFNLSMGDLAELLHSHLNQMSQQLCLRRLTCTDFWFKTGLNQHYILLIFPQYNTNSQIGQLRTIYGRSLICFKFIVVLFVLRLKSPGMVGLN